MSAPDQGAQDVRRRLRRRADELGLDFQQAIQYYAIERSLYRLSQSEYASKMVVKGATMLRVWHASISRPTRDIDILGWLDNSPESITQVIETCVRMDLPSDGLAFEQSVTVQRITLESKYPGIRAKLRGTCATPSLRRLPDGRPRFRTKPQSVSLTRSSTRSIPTGCGPPSFQG